MKVCTARTILRPHAIHGPGHCLCRTRCGRLLQPGTHQARNTHPGSTVSAVRTDVTDASEHIARLATITIAGKYQGVCIHGIKAPAYFIAGTTVSRPTIVPTAAQIRD